MFVVDFAFVTPKFPNVFIRNVLKIYLLPCLIEIFSVFTCIDRNVEVHPNCNHYLALSSRSLRKAYRVFGKVAYYFLLCFKIIDKTKGFIWDRGKDLAEWARNQPQVFASRNFRRMKIAL